MLHQIVEEWVVVVVVVVDLLDWVRGREEE